MVRVDGYACPKCETTSYYLYPQLIRTYWLVGNELYLKCPNGRWGIVEEYKAALRYHLGLPASAQFQIDCSTPFHPIELLSKTFSYEVLHTLFHGIEKGKHPGSFQELAKRVNLAQQNHRCPQARKKSI